MSQLPRYESYKDSGVQWLGEIPSHWNTMAVRRILEEHRQGYYTNEPYIEDGVKLARITDIQSTSEMSLDNSPRVENKVELKEFFLQENDFLFARTGGAGSFGIVRQKDLPAVYASYLIRFRFKETVEAEYLKFFFKSSYFLNSLVANIHGGVNQNIHAEDIKSTFLALPPIEEQKEIANFLNAKIEKVNILIAKQETLLEKLAEQRVALISHAVTKGLNPGVELKESDVVLLGNIPNTWNVKRLKFLLSEKLKYGANESAESEDKENPRYIRITDIDDSGNLKDETFKSLESEKAQEYLLDDLDILLARSGATVGKSYLYKAESVGIACYAGYLIRARLDQENYNPEFVNYFLQSKQYWDWISSINIQATIQNVSAEKYNDLTLAIPPLEEQKQLIEYLKNEDEKFNRAIGKGKKLVHLLNEYRSTLITQVVTGKIDVRNLKVN